MSTGSVMHVGAAAACGALLFLSPGLAGLASAKDARTVRHAKPAAVAATAATAATAYSSTKSTAHAPEPQAAPVQAADPGCPKERRKLWVEGEGWVVRRVANCF